ncbi:MAG: transglycosylase SLT domain-containing protein, partial [Flavobacteriaceae bacterium]|nr:transglycosylase SLT domain-containing protein [Flavobacteriaceae bacterium]
MKFAGMMIALLCLFFLSSIQPDPSVDFSEIAPEILNDKYVKDYNVYALPLPKNASFAGELVPLNDIDVRERLDREMLVNTYWQSNGLLLIKRANRYFPLIEKILEEEGVPEDFKYLALIESGFLNVVSPAGATGFWQFMKGTAKEYGLEVNNNVDERYN